MKYGFIGCGNMGGVLARAAAKAVGGERVFVADHHKDKTGKIAQECGACVSTALTVARECDFIFLGVKPQVFARLAEEIAPTLAERETPFVLVSMAAGITVEGVCRMFGAFPVIRIMPNTPASVGRGILLYCRNMAVTEEQLGSFLEAMKYTGVLDPIAEEKIDAASALSGCGPAFVCMFLSALADGAVECGIPYQKALLYACETLAGTAEMVKASGKNPEELKAAVCSPGGTTIAGVHALEDGAFRALCMDAVTAAYEKTLRMKK